MFRKILALITATASLSIPVAVLYAQTATPSLSRDVDNNLYVSGLAPNTEFELTFPNADRLRTIVANPCGALIMRTSSTAPLPSSFEYRPTGATTSTATVTPSTLPLGLLPSCTNGQWDVAPTANFKTSSNTIVIIGVAPNVSHQIVTKEQRIRRARANECGFARFGNSTSNPTPATVLAGGSTVTVADLPDRPLLCRQGRTFAPVEAVANPNP